MQKHRKQYKTVIIAMAVIVAIGQAGAWGAAKQITFASLNTSFPLVHFSGTNFSEDDDSFGARVSVPKFNTDWGTFDAPSFAHGFNAEYEFLSWDIAGTGGTTSNTSVGVGCNVNFTAEDTTDEELLSFGRTDQWITTEENPWYGEYPDPLTDNRLDVVSDPVGTGVIAVHWYHDWNVAKFTGVNGPGSVEGEIYGVLTGLLWVTYHYDDTNGNPPLPGDTNGDGTVNLLDLVTLGEHYNETGILGFNNGDFDGDNDVDLADLVTLGEHYNETGGGTFGTPVQPTTSVTVSVSDAATTDLTGYTTYTLHIVSDDDYDIVGVSLDITASGSVEMNQITEILGWPIDTLWTDYDPAMESQGIPADQDTQFLWESSDLSQTMQCSESTTNLTGDFICPAFTDRDVAQVVLPDGDSVSYTGAVFVEEEDGTVTIAISGTIGE